MATVITHTGKDWHPPSRGTIANGRWIHKFKRLKKTDYGYWAESYCGWAGVAYPDDRQVNCKACHKSLDRRAK